MFNDGKARGIGDFEPTAVFAREQMRVAMGVVVDVPFVQQRPVELNQIADAEVEAALLDVVGSVVATLAHALFDSLTSDAEVGYQRKSRRIR